MERRIAPCGLIRPAFLFRTRKPWRPEASVRSSARTAEARAGRRRGIALHRRWRVAAAVGLAGRETPDAQVLGARRPKSLYTAGAWPRNGSGRLRRRRARRGFVSLPLASRVSRGGWRGILGRGGESPSMPSRRRRTNAARVASSRSLVEVSRLRRTRRARTPGDGCLRGRFRGIGLGRQPCRVIGRGSIAGDQARLVVRPPGGIRMGL